MTPDVRAALVRNGILELRHLRGRLEKVTVEDVHRLLELIDVADPAITAAQRAELGLPPADPLPAGIPRKDPREAKVTTLLEALEQLERDAHYFSTRPCMTCSPISRLVGRPFGCYAEAERRRAAEVKHDPDPPAADRRPAHPMRNPGGRW